MAAVVLVVEQGLRRMHSARPYALRQMPVVASLSTRAARPSEPASSGGSSGNCPRRAYSNPMRAAQRPLNETQRSLFSSLDPASVNPQRGRTAKSADSTSGSFVGNMSLPVHRWFRYSAGFSGAWAGDLISREATGRSLRVFDPFAGSGTTLVAAEHCGVESMGIDSHPFVARIAQAKLAYRSSLAAYARQAARVFDGALECRSSLESHSPLIRKCYSDPALDQLDRLRRSFESRSDDSEADRLVWLTLISILRSTSRVGTANWQYLLPNRRKARVLEPFAAFKRMTRVIHDDMRLYEHLSGPRAKFLLDDARTCSEAPSDRFNLVVTSPPYPNNYDYADATRLELAFLGEVRTWGDLHGAIRRHLLRSCTQHVPNKAVDLPRILADPKLAPIEDELRAVCDELGEIRLTRGGKKTYHNMIACYFLDLASVWTALRRVCSSPCKVCFVIGDSAPYGVYVPVVDWLSRLACAAGFENCTFEKTRDRNTKWKNRKHRVPLCEGRLWVEG